MRRTCKQEKGKVKGKGKQKQNGNACRGEEEIIGWQLCSNSKGPWHALLEGIYLSFTDGVNRGGCQ